MEKIKNKLMFLPVDEITSVRRGYIIRVINVTHFGQQASNVSLTFMDLWMLINIKIVIKWDEVLF